MSRTLAITKRIMAQLVHDPRTLLLLLGAPLLVIWLLSMILNTDALGPAFIALLIYVFTFVTSTMSLVREREAGTMARFLATPVAPVQVIAGYAIAFGLVGLVQSGIILAIALGPMGMPNEGNLEFVLVVAVSMAVVSVMMGLALSGLANTGFQVVQLMLVFVVPQILLCGLFDLSAAPLPLQVLSRLLPLTYGVDALQEVMLYGSGRDVITPDLIAIAAFALLFLVVGVLAMRKKRARKEAAT